MSAPKPTTARLHLLPATRLAGLGRRWRRRGVWRRLLEMPWVWVGFLLLAGGAALTPGAFLLSSLGAPRLAAGSVASRDYVASRDLMLYDEAASRVPPSRYATASAGAPWTGRRKEGRGASDSAKASPKRASSRSSCARDAA